MPASQATIQTGNPGRYLTQLCQHASKMGKSRLHRPRSHAGGGEPPEIQHAEWSAADGTVTLNWGQWTVRAAPGALMLRAEAGSEENLQRIQELITARLEKIGRRDHLAVNWQPAEVPGDASLLPGDSCRPWQLGGWPTLRRGLTGSARPLPVSCGRDGCGGRRVVAVLDVTRTACADAPGSNARRVG
jgi:hypothetical protein